MRVQGWDPVLLTCQIIALQTIHYLALSIITPPLLSFTSPTLLAYSGGASTVGHIMDWRDMAARPTISRSAFHGLLDFSASDSWRKLRGAWAGGKHIGQVVEADGEESGGPTTTTAEGQDEAAVDDTTVDEYERWDQGVDDTRGWLIGLAWLIACGIDIAPLYYIVQRPTYILDFSLTLTFIHLIITSYYAAAFPTSIFFWVVMSIGAVTITVVAEQLCVKREMQTELDVGWNPEDIGEGIELGHVART